MKTIILTIGILMLSTSCIKNRKDCDDAQAKHTQSASDIAKLSNTYYLNPTQNNLNKLNLAYQNQEQALKAIAQYCK